MPDEFKYDVFLSHSSKDKAVVHALAERLQADGLRVRFDESNDPAKIEEVQIEPRVRSFWVRGIRKPKPRRL